MNKFRAAAIQMPTVEDKMENIKAVRHYLEQIKAQKVDFVVLPEMFCCPYQTEKFPEYAEEEGGSVWKALSAYAKEYNIYLVAGSVPEKDDEGRVYNTCYIFDRQGVQIGKHRKTHLFDIDVKGGQSFKESDTLTAGNSGTVFETEFGRMGVMICFDIRFPEFARMMVNDGAKMIFVPAAFNMTTWTGTLGAFFPRPCTGQPDLYAGMCTGTRPGGFLHFMGTFHIHRSMGQSRGHA